MNTIVVSSHLTQAIQHYVTKWLATSRWFSPGTPVSSTNKTDRHDITEILLKVALSTINQTNSIPKWGLRSSEHIATSVSWWLNILCIMFNIIAFFTATLCIALMFEGFHFTYMWQNLHDCIISLRREVWIHKTGLTSQLYIRTHVSSLESERSYTCVFMVSIVSLYHLCIGLVSCSNSLVFCFVFHIIPLLARKVHYCALYGNNY
jgi:hypothetical protein